MEIVSPRTEMPSANPLSLGALFWTFLRIACTSFGGFMVMISAVQQVIVDRRKLLSNQDMLDGISLASVLPGPMAINVVAYVGYRLRGAAGAITCVCAAVAPAFLLMTGLSMAYFHWGNIPSVGKIFMGFIPAVVAIIVAAGWNMGRQSITRLEELVLAIASSVALSNIGGFYITPLIVVISAIVGWRLYRQPIKCEIEKKHDTRLVETDSPAVKKTPSLFRKNAGLLLVASTPALLGPFIANGSGILLKLFCTFAGISLMLFGGNYVFIPLLQEIVVNSHGWVTQQEFVDATAMSQLMPGPAIVSAAFVGLKVAGIAGAFAATMAIVAPSAIVMVICTQVLERIKSHAAITAALRGVRAASVGLIFAGAFFVAKSAAPSWASVMLFTIALVLQLRYRIEAIWIVPIAGLSGFLLY